MKYLDNIGILAGTDKSRLEHDYLRQYERLFQPFANEAITLIEIGVHNGASLTLWEKYFPKAQIIGIDIEPSTRKFERERVHIEIGSQFDADFLVEIGNKYSASIIIDDGSHEDEHQIFSFQQLFPFLLPGGIYIVEDIQGYKSKTPAADYFLELQRSCLLRRPMLEVAAIEVIKGAVLIHKTNLDELDENYFELEKIISRSEQAEATLYLSRYMQNHGAPFDATLRLAQRACSLAPNNPWAKFHLSKVFAEQGDKAGAILAIKEAIRLVPVPHSLFVEQLRKLQVRD